MKKLIIILAILFLASCFSFCGCAGDKEIYRKYLMNGYESYDDLRRTNMIEMYAAYGTASLCTDKRFVSEGESCMKLALDLTSDNVSPSLNYCGFKYAMSEYENEFGWIDKITEFGMDIYNADEREYSVTLAVIGDHDSVVMTAGATLGMQSRSSVRFQLKPWFFEPDTMITEYRIYINGIADTENLKATLYIDNVAIYYGNNSTPVIEGSEGEILSFDSPAETDAVLTKCDLPLWGFVPLFSASYDSTVKIGKTYGALEAKIDHSGTYGLAWSMGNGYDIYILEEIAKKASGTKTISVVCRNDTFSERGVSLIAVIGEREVVQKEYIASGVTKKIVLDVDGAEIDGIILRIDSWKVSEEGLLYFADLRYDM